MSKKNYNRFVIRSLTDYKTQKKRSCVDTVKLLRIKQPFYNSTIRRRKLLRLLIGINMPSFNVSFRLFLSDSLHVNICEYIFGKLFECAFLDIYHANGCGMPSPSKCYLTAFRHILRANSNQYWFYLKLYYNKTYADIYLSF